MKFVLHHVAFNVSDLAQSIEFYQKLGFQKTLYFESTTKPTRIQFLEQDGLRVELTSRDNNAEPWEYDSSKSVMKHFALQSTDIKKDHEELCRIVGSASEIKYKGLPNGGYVNFFYIKDPDNLDIEIVQFVPEI